MVLRALKVLGAVRKRYALLAVLRVDDADVRLNGGPNDGWHVRSGRIRVVDRRIRIAADDANG